MRTNIDPTPAKAVLLLAAFALPATASADSHLDELVRTMYLAEVANYCSLADAEIVAGYRRERDRIVAASKITPEEVEMARTAAWKLGYAEWQNRGLGGFRGWCRGEGGEAESFFRARARE